MMQRLGQKDADGEDEFWMPDDKVTFCIGCERKFTFWYRKHHCRVCGRIFCAACSSHVISGLTLGKANPDPVRACDACFEQKSQPHPSEAPEQLADVDVPPTPGGSEPEPAPGEDSGPAPFLRTTPLMQTSTTEVSLERGASGEPLLESLLESSGGAGPIALAVGYEAELARPHMLEPFAMCM